MQVTFKTDNALSAPVATKYGCGFPSGRTGTRLNVTYLCRPRLIYFSLKKEHHFGLDGAV